MCTPKGVHPVCTVPEIWTFPFPPTLCGGAHVIIVIIAIISIIATIVVGTNLCEGHPQGCRFVHRVERLPFSTIHDENDKY